MRVLIAAVLCFATVSDVRAAPGDWTVTRVPFDRAVVARYRQLLARDPHDPALRALVTLYRRYRTVELLQQEYGEALARGDGGAHVIAGRIARLTNDEAQALALWTRASELRPDDAQTFMLLGELHRAGGRVPEARQAYQHAIDLGPPRVLVVVAHTAAAELATTAGDAVAIDTHYQALVALDPKSVRTWTARGDALTATRPDAAIASFEEAERLLVGDPARRIELIAKQATLHAKQQRYHPAISELRRAISWAPRGSGTTMELTRQIVEHARSAKYLLELRGQLEREWPAKRRTTFEWVTLGGLYAETRSPELALAAFDAAIALDSLDLAPRRLAIEILDKLGRRTEATQRFQALLLRLPRDARLHLDFAKRVWPTSRETAILTLTELGARSPRDIGTQVAIADQFIHWQQPVHAVPAYERAAKLDPEYLGSLALALGQAHDINGLVAFAARLRDARQIEKVANVMLDHAMWKEARAAFGAAIALAPERGELYSGRAGAHEGLEQFDEAAADAARALVLATTTDGHRLRVLRHALVRVVARTKDREERWATWREQLAREPSHRDLAALLADFNSSVDLGAGSRVMLLETIAARVPSDPGVHHELAKLLPELDRYTEAIEILERLAKLPDQDLRAIAAEIATVRAAWAKRAEDVEWQRQALRIGVFEPLPDRHDAANQKLRPGARIGVGIGNEMRRLSFGLVATLQLGGGDVAGVARLDWSEGSTEAGHLRIIGGSAGLVTRLATGPNALFAIGGAVRVEGQQGPGVPPIGVALEGTLDLTSRWTPFGLGLRLGHYLGGGTAASLDFVVEWR